MLLLKKRGRSATQVGRLAWQMAIALMLAMGLVGACMYQVARYRLELEVDNALRRDLPRLLPAGAPARLQMQGMARRLAALEAERAISEKAHALFDRQGRQVFGRIRLPLPSAGLSTIAFADGPRAGRTGRALTVQLRDGSWLVVVAESEIVEDLGTTLLPLTISLFLAAGLVGLLGNWLLGRLLAERIERTTRVAGAIAAGKLSERVPVAGLDGIFAAQAEAFNAMLDRIEDLIRNHEQFTWNVAHDLRTPLTRLQGLLAGSRKGQAHRAEQAAQECENLIRTFEALLRLADLEGRHKQRVLASLDLAELVDELAETMEPVLADRGIALCFAPVPAAQIVVDRDLVLQLFVNLLDNVAIHTPAGTTALVTFEVEHAFDRLRITLTDDGPGLDGCDSDAILKPFVRGTASAQSRGSGLGLSVARAIAHFHGGSLALQDMAPGLRVEIALPLAA